MVLKVVMDVLGQKDSDTAAPRAGRGASCHHRAQPCSSGAVCQDASPDMGGHCGELDLAASR